MSYSSYTRTELDVEARHYAEADAKRRGEKGYVSHIHWTLSLGDGVSLHVAYRCAGEGHETNCAI